MFIIFKLQCMVVMGGVLIVGLFLGGMAHEYVLNSDWLFRHPDRGIAESAGLLAVVVPMWFAGRLVSRTTFASQYRLKMQYFAFAVLAFGIFVFFKPFPDYQAKTLARMEEEIGARARKITEWHARIETTRKQLNPNDATAVAFYNHTLAAYTAELEQVKSWQAKAQALKKRLGKE